jgi:hypothetical protein
MRTFGRARTAMATNDQQAQRLTITIAHFDAMIERMKTLPRAGRCWGLCRRRYRLTLNVHVRIPAFEDGPQLPVECLHARLQQQMRTGFGLLHLLFFTEAFAHHLIHLSLSRFLSGMMRLGTGSVSCNSVFVLHLCRFLNQEELMKREAMVQNPSSHCRDLTCREMYPHKIMHNPVHI